MPSGQKTNPATVAEIRRLTGLGWSIRRIAAHLGVSINAVKKNRKDVLTKDTAKTDSDADG